MRHGLTLGELGGWFVAHASSSTSTTASSRWRAGSRTPAPGFGWPLGERAWINPSPNAPNLWMARAYAGTVMLEGATLSEGRGTTRPLELFGAPDIDARARHRRDARAGAAVAGRLPSARLLVRADLPQACRQALQRRADRHRRPRLRPRRLQALARQALAFKAIRASLSRTTTSGATSPTNTRRASSPST
jgi:hypothetical protein